MLNCVSVLLTRIDGVSHRPTCRPTVLQSALSPRPRAPRLCSRGRQGPNPLNGLGQEDPGSLREGGVSGGRRHQVGELADHGELLVAVEGPGVGQNLDPHIPTVAVHIGNGRTIHLVDEARRVLPEHRDVRDTLDGHQRPCQV